MTTPSAGAESFPNIAFSAARGTRWPRSLPLLIAALVLIALGCGSDDRDENASMTYDSYFASLGYDYNPARDIGELRSDTTTTRPGTSVSLPGGLLLRQQQRLWTLRTGAYSVTRSMVPKGDISTSCSRRRTQLVTTCSCRDRSRPRLSNFGRCYPSEQRASSIFSQTTIPMTASGSTSGRMATSGSSPPRRVGFSITPTGASSSRSSVAACSQRTRNRRRACTTGFRQPSPKWPIPHRRREDGWFGGLMRPGRQGRRRRLDASRRVRCDLRAGLAAEPHGGLAWRTRDQARRVTPGEHRDSYAFRGSAWDRLHRRDAAGRCSEH